MKISNLHNFEINSKYANVENTEVYKDTLLKAVHYPPGYTKKIHPQTYAPYFLAKDGELFVENIDTVSALIKYSDEPTCVLNMASYKTPGGGVAYGAKAQEECLFRCSNLGVSVSVDHYPLIGNATLYTTDAIFFKDKDYNDLSHGYLVDVITSPAIKIVDGIKEENYEELTEEKIKLMLDLAAAYDQENLILGAWGCGVYKNDPTYIAGLFKKHLENHGKRYWFKRVIFAIIDDYMNNNYETFKRILGWEG